MKKLRCSECGSILDAQHDLFDPDVLHVPPCPCGRKSFDEGWAEGRKQLAATIIKFAKGEQK